MTVLERVGWFNLPLLFRGVNSTICILSFKLSSRLPTGESS